jgi:hypothetical protein
MQYALMIYAEPGYLEALPDADQAAARAEFEALREDARYVGGTWLQPAETATCVRVAGGRTLMTDDPFADTKRCSAASSWSRRPTSTGRSRWPRASRLPG